MQDEKTIQKREQTRKANASKRKEKEAQREQEQRILRKRLIEIIDNPQTTDKEALQAISLLHDMDDKRWKY